MRAVIQKAVAAVPRAAWRDAAVALAVAAGFVAYVLLAPLDPPGEALSAPGTAVLAADGTLLQRDTAGGVRIPVTLDRVAPQAIAATLAAEDQRFYSHPGVDPLAIARAITHPGTRSGASTVTQQLARRLYLGGKGGPLLVRKLREALIALRLETRHSKDEILEAYLNDAPYGRGAYGIEAAARVYFGVPARDLDVAQASFLAGLPRLPRAGGEAGLETARSRQRYVLERMRAGGRISAGEARDAASTDLRILAALEPPLAPHFVARALDEIRRERPDLAGRRDLVVETTLDAGLQRETERIVRLRLDELRGNDVSNAAAVIVDPASGRVLALAGNAGPGAPAANVDLSAALRQPGSALKPFLYAAALERGYSAATPLLDVPATFASNEGPYAPLNNDRRFNGPVPLRVALASSLNLPAVATLDQLGLDAFLEITRRAGLSTLTDTERYGLAIVLGGAEVRLFELTAAYGAFAALGERVEPFTVARVRDTRGRLLYERSPRPAERVFAPEIAWLIGDILRDRDARVPGFGRGSALEAAIPAAVKTGTTTEFRDNWAVGFTPRAVVGVWAGNADNRPMGGVTGVSGAAPIWRDLIEIANRGSAAAPPPPPPALTRAAVCTPTGLRPGPDCPIRVEEWFVRGTEPQATERYYVRGADGVLGVNPPPPARAWAADAGLVLASGGGSGSVSIVQPAPGAVISLTPELAASETLIRATSAGAEAIELRVDGVVAGRLPGNDVRIPWRLTAGQHVVEAIAIRAGGPAGSAYSTFEVRAREARP